MRREGNVWRSLRQIGSRLEQLGIPYAVVGGIAIQHFGLQRSTQGLDLLISATDLGRVHGELIGQGYQRKTPGSRRLRDEVTRVRIEFLISGDYPGDGQPKPVRFPVPGDVFERSDEGLCFVNLAMLIEPKLASAKSTAHRIKDRADVLELIHLLSLPASFAERLNPYVQQEFRDLAALPPPTEGD